MYTNYNREALSGLETSTKYTEYLQSLSNGDISPSGENYFTEGAAGNRNRSQRRRRRNNLEGSTPLLYTSDNEVKFANIFSPNESNALKLHLLQKTSSLPILGPEDDKNNNDNNNARGDSGGSAVRGDDDSSAVDHQYDSDSRLRNRRRSTAIGLLHENRNNNNNVANSRRKGDPVANILYSTIRHGAVTSNNNNGNDYDNPSADETLHTGSDSKVDYDPHEPLAAVDQIALRHELLNNIRAISRATYFEDLYTGKVRKNSASPEAEILRLLENKDAAVVSSSVAEDTLGETTIPSKDTNLSRVDRWVKESSQASSRAAQHSNDTDEDNKVGQHASLYHQSVWDEEHGREKKKSKGKGKLGVSGRGRGRVSEVTTDSDGETPSAYIRRLTEASKYQNSNSNNTNNNNTIGEHHDPTSVKHFSKNTDSRNVVVNNMGKPIIPSGFIASSSAYLREKYLNDSNPSIYKSNERFLVVDTSPQHGSRRPFSFGVSNSTDDYVPLTVSLPNVAQNVSTPYRPTPVHASSYRTHGVPGAENLTHSMANLSTGTTSTKNTVQKTRLDKRKLHATTSDEQVGRRTMAPIQQKSQQLLPKNATVRVIRHSERTGPGIYTRLNMNQWVVTKVCFYVNGDELHPRFEYRFRAGKDIRDLDQLLDLLTKRFPVLPAGARYIFTMDGYPINSLDELINENSYVVSSIRKFKTIKYGNGPRDGETFGSGVFPDIRGNKKGGGTQREHKRLSRQLSASDGNLHREKRNETRKQGQSFANQKAISSLNSKSVSDVPKLVAHVIEEASSNVAALNRSPLMAREPIRVVNASRPSLQSQVLLNTKTSQPFEDLVKDLAMSVRVPKQPIGNCLKTLAGRQIKSYSQLRSELRAGQRAFFVYSETNKPVAASTSKPNVNSNRLHVNGKPVVKAALGKVNSNSSSDLSIVSTEDRMKDTRRKSQRRRSHSPTTMHLRTHSRLAKSRTPSPYN